MPLSAGCGATKDNLEKGMFLTSSDLLLLRRTFSFAHYFLGKSHVEVSLAMCFRTPSSSFSSSRVFNFLCGSVCVAYLVSQKSCHWLSQLPGGSGVVQLMLSFTPACTQMDTSQSFQKSLFPTSTSSMRSVVLMNLY